jgi:radical SAM protein with 4Fe4S-binding SPASM domain
MILVLRLSSGENELTEIATLPREQIQGRCDGCRHFHNCRGACRGITFAHTGDLFASFPFCLKL